MPTFVTCNSCRNRLKAPDRFAGKRANCPVCGSQVTFATQTTPPSGAPESSSDLPPVRTPPPDIPFFIGAEEPLTPVEFLDPPAEPPLQSPPAPPPEPWARRMFEALLDPRSIQWLLTLGGGLMVLGGLIWLISKGVFENPLMLAVLLTTASVALLAGGWYMSLRTKFRVAGKALTFLACVVLPLNLWFYHIQGIVLLEQGLWVGGLVCVLLYAATVWVLRDPLFMYAVEAGITLTAVLLLGSFGLAGHATHLCILLVSLALISIHAHKAFPKDGEDSEVFTEDRFGLPLFWCGHAQLGTGLVILLVTQIAAWLVGPLGNVFEIPPNGILLTNTLWTPALLYLAGAYAYLYSDFVVRRIGLYVYLAAICLVMAEITLIGFGVLGVEGLIAMLALTALGVSISVTYLPPGDGRMGRVIPSLALALSVAPVVMGLFLHYRSTSFVLTALDWNYVPTWKFIAAMLVVAVANRLSAYFYRKRTPRLAAAYFFFSAAGLMVAVAGTLRFMNFTQWHQQAPLLMLVPLAYLVASRLWRGHTPERPLRWVAHAGTVVVLLYTLLGIATVALGERPAAFHLLVSGVLAEAAVFYGLAARFRRNTACAYLAVAAACLAVWQLMLHVALPPVYFTLLFAVLGIALLAAARMLGLDEAETFAASGRRRTQLQGRGLPVLRAGHAVLIIALLAGFLQGLGQVAGVVLDKHELGTRDWFALAMLTSISVAAIWVAPPGKWRRAYLVAAIAMFGLTCLTLNVALDISPWRKLELFLVISGLAMLIAGNIGRFREDESRPNELTSTALWLGSLLAALPPLVAVFYYWADRGDFSPLDEFTLLTVTLLMLATGVVWRVQSTTLLGGGALAIYLAALSVSLIYQPQVAVGVYLAVGGALLFAIGIALSMYRERLLSLPQRIANREGIFRVIGWR